MKKIMAKKKKSTRKKKSQPVRKPPQKISKLSILLVSVSLVAVITLMIVSNRQDSVIKPTIIKDEILKRSAYSEFRKHGELAILSSADDTLINLDIEIPENDLLREVGLMFRESMEEHQAMLFIFPEEQERSFWMKNTILPLDMMFISADKQIVKIHKNTTPYHQGHYFSGSPSKYVLEVNAGFCDRHNIKDGDKIDWTAF